MAGIPFHRYVYGKIVGTIGGPVEAGFEHKITCVTRGFPAAALKFCDPTHRIDATLLRSTRMLVHPAVQRQGAFFLLPVRAGDRTYMSASRLRARSEAGETESEITPGRTYTQYDLYLFQAVVWAEHAPWLLATIPGWLRTDPTLQRDFERRREIPEERLPAGPDRFPFQQDTTLPGTDSQVWSMLDALESIETPGVFGPATGFPHEKGFCFELARATALLPPHLRVYVTVAGNVSGVQRDCAIQFIPGASGGLPERLRAPGFFRQLATERQDRNSDSWHTRLSEEQAFIQGVEDPFSMPEGARHRLAGVLTALGEEKSLDALEDYLTGRSHHPPCELTREKTKAKWLVRLDDYLRQIAQGKPIAGIAQGKPVAEFPERAVELTAGLTGAEWAAAWRHAFRQVGSAQGRRLLAWSALRSDTEGDGVVDAIPVGELPDFQSLRQVWNLLENYRTHRSENISEDSDPLSRQGILVRMKRLPGRTPQILADNPFELLAFADLDEIGRSLLASERDNQGRKEPGSKTESTLTSVRHAARLLERQPPTEFHRPSRDFSRLAEATEAILNASFPRRQEGDSRTPLLGYLECRLRADAEPGQAFWQTAFNCALYEQAGDEGPERVWQTLFDLLDTYPCDPPGESELRACFDQALTHLARHTRDKAHLLVTMLRACIWHGPESLIPAAPPGHTKNAWARSLQGLLFDILPTLEPNTVLGELTSEVTSLCRGFQTIGGRSSRNLNFCTTLLESMLERLARCGAAGREDTLRLLQPLNRLLFNFGWDPRNPNPLVDMRRLNNRLQECILSWAEGPEPYLTPFSPDPSEWKTDADKLRPEPLRYHLAQSLGNPYCVYYGHVAAEIRNGPDTRVEGIEYNDDPRRNLLIARCAVMEWKTRFKHERTSSNTNLKSFLTVKKYRHTTEDALTAIQSIARSRNTHYLDEFGWDLVYALELLATIDPVIDREDLYGTRCDDVLTGSAPEEMRAALLANRGENFDNICFGAFLASVMVVNNLGPGKGFHGFLSSDLTKARERFRIRILGRPQSWAEFNKLSPEQIAHRLDRVLFLLHLWAQAALKSQKSTDYSPQKSGTIFELPSGLRSAVAGSLQATPKYLDTFKRLFTRIGIDGLPGWPTD